MTPYTIPLFSILLHIYQKPMRNVTSADDVSAHHLFCRQGFFALVPYYLCHIHFIYSMNNVALIPFRTHTHTPISSVCWLFEFVRHLVCMLEVIRLTSFLIKIRILKYLVSLDGTEEKATTKKKNYGFVVSFRSRLYSVRVELC